MNPFNTILILISFTISLTRIIATEGYYKVVYETCDELRTTKSYFDGFLLPCATYNFEPVSFVCLTDEQTATELIKLPDWTLITNATTGNSIFRSFKFEDFRGAFLFMSEAAQLAETNQHHPDWRNLYDTVDITLTTDDQKCLSTFDVQFAQGLDYIFKISGNSLLKR